MARLTTIGFELNSAVTGVEFYLHSGLAAPTIQTTIKRSGSYAAQVSAAGGYKGLAVRFVGSASSGPYFVRFYLYIGTAMSAATTILTLNNDGNSVVASPIAMLTLDGSHVLRLYDEDGQVTGTSTLSLSTWYRIELKFSNVGGAGAGILEAKVDGAAAFASSSTRSFSAGVQLLGLGVNLGSSEFESTGVIYFDDVAINDGAGSFQNDYPGAGEVIYLRPNDNGDNSDFGGSDGNSTNNYLLVNEIPPDDATSYVEDNTSGQIDDYNVDATPAAMESGDTISAVQVWARAAVSAETGGDPDIVLRIKAAASGTVEESAAWDVATASPYLTNNGTTLFNPMLTLYDLPGASTTAWTKADLDTAQIGIRESATDTHFARVTAIWVIVDHKPGSGTAYNQSASGGLTPSGAIAKRAGKKTAGGATPSGALLKSARKVIAGVITPAGVVLKRAGKVVAGSLTPSGVLAAVRLFFKAISGALTPTGALAKRAGKVTSGAMTPAGVLLKRAGKIASGTLTPTGAITKRIAKVFAGGITPGGVLASIRLFAKAVSGAITPAGTLVKRARKIASGSLAPAGVLVKQANKIAAGNILPTGSLIKRTAKVFAGALTPSGAMTTIKLFVKALSGVITATGSLLTELFHVVASNIRGDAPHISKRGEPQIIPARTDEELQRELERQAALRDANQRVLAENRRRAQASLDQIFRADAIKAEELKLTGGIKPQTPYERQMVKTMLDQKVQQMDAVDRWNKENAVRLANLAKAQAALEAKKEREADLAKQRLKNLAKARRVLKKKRSK